MIEVTATLAGHEAAYLALEAEASGPYTGFVYADAAQAARVQQLLFERDVGEFARVFGQICLVHGEVAGMIACVPGAELGKARLRAALALRRSGLATDDDVARRTSLAAPALVRVAEDDFYLARIAVSAAHRGAGVGRRLLAAHEASARAVGARRLVLDVSPTHADALRLYQRAGFAVTGGLPPIVDPAAPERTLHYLHLTKPLAS